MKKWIIIASLVLVICVIVIIGYIGVLGNDAPTHVSYYGKPLTYWFQPWRTPIDMVKVSTEPPFHNRGEVISIQKRSHSW